MSKILCLCSGGFDSVVMLHKIREDNPQSEIHTLFFDYGQKIAKYERERALSNSTKLGCVFHEIKLPKFSWTSNSFYSEGYVSNESECLEMRNMVFISYALSVALSIKADSIYMAILKSHGYYDTSDIFIDRIKGVAKDNGISFECPFSSVNKYQLAYLAHYYGITSNDFISCDNAVDGVPCGVCPDCKCLSVVLNYSPIPMDRWRECFNPNDPYFLKLLKNSPIEEMRVYTNMSCQLSCEHCYYGYSSLVSSPLSLDEWKNVFKQAKEEGINAFHFSGKEPLYDESVFDIIKVLKEVHPHSEISFVTNGINIPKYSDLLKEVNPAKVCVSVDEIGTPVNSIRKVQNVAYKAIKILQEKGVFVEVFVDLHEGNVSSLYDILNGLYSWGVNKVHVRTIVPIGKSSNFVPLSDLDINNAYCAASLFSREHPLIDITLALGIFYSYRLIDGCDKGYLPVTVALNSVISDGNPRLYPNFSFMAELFCGSFERQITITPDGYVQGCASETSYCDYVKHSAGNVRDKSLHDLIQIGKDNSLFNTAKIFNSGKFLCSCCLETT